MVTKFGLHWGRKYGVILGARCMQIGVVISNRNMKTVQYGPAALGVPLETKRQMDKAIKQYSGTIGFECTAGEKNERMAGINTVFR